MDLMSNKWRDLGMWSSRRHHIILTAFPFWTIKYNENWTTRLVLSPSFLKIISLHLLVQSIHGHLVKQ